MTPSGESDSRVWVNPETGGLESTAEWQRRLNAGDPEAHRQLAELANPVSPTVFLVVVEGEDGDDVRGVYATREMAEAALAQIDGLPGDYAAIHPWAVTG